MGRGKLIPVTPSVLAWAIDESGYSRPAFEAELKFAVADFLAGKAQPTLTQTRRIAEVLKRPLATFLLPAPPNEQSPAVDFRGLVGESRLANPDERRSMREAIRQQRMLGWMTRELDAYPKHLPQLSVKSNPEEAAHAVRELLGVTPTKQQGWKSASVAFREWRQALEDLGVFVFLFPIGKTACRAFSVWDDVAPVIGINTGWRVEARVFSLFHEVGHLVTRTSSVCVEEWSGELSKQTDPTERWCERFAAALLMPTKALEGFLSATYGWSSGQKLDRLDVAKKAAGQFRVSLRAAALRMIEGGMAGWGLYRGIPATADDKSKGGAPPDEPRTRFKIRFEQFGARAASLYLRAVQRDILDRSDVLGYLDIGDDDFDRIQNLLAPGAA